jgi:hypothetical protein
MKTEHLPLVSVVKNQFSPSRPRPSPGREGKIDGMGDGRRLTNLKCEAATICGGRPEFFSLANDAARGEPPTEFNWAQGSFPERCRRPQGGLFRPGDCSGLSRPLNARGDPR